MIWSGYLQESLSPAPNEEALGPVLLELGDGFHQAAEASFLERGDADELVSGADQDVELTDQRFGRSGRGFKHAKPLFVTENQAGTAAGGSRAAPHNAGERGKLELERRHAAGLGDG